MLLFALLLLLITSNRLVSTTDCSDNLLISKRQESQEIPQVRKDLILIKAGTKKFLAIKDVLEKSLAVPNIIGVPRLLLRLGKISAAIQTKVKKLFRTYIQTDQAFSKAALEECP